MENIEVKMSVNQESAYVNRVNKFNTNNSHYID